MRLNAFVPGIAAECMPSDTALAAIETIDRTRSLALAYSLAYYLTRRKSLPLFGNCDIPSQVATCTASLR